jgi:REP-associated tyrosine transposase
MPRRARSELPDGVFHVTAHSVFDQQLFVDDEDRRAFVWLLGEVTTRFRLRCFAYCLMATHYHLLVEGRAADLGDAMQRLNGRFARRFNERHLRRGHVFGQRYSAWVVRDEEHLDETYRYIGANPVKAGLCKAEEDWPWTWIAPGGVDGARNRSFRDPPPLPTPLSQGQA